MYRILIDSMKGKLPLVILTTTIIMVCAATTIALLVLQQYPQTAQASPCNGDNGKEYCTGYHDGAIQAHNDFKTGDDLDVDQHRCTGSEEYCTGYNRGCSDEEDFLG
jgi:hypothetical protein